MISYQTRTSDVQHCSFITVDEAFRRYAGVSAFDADKDGTFDELMVLKVEPELGKNCPELANAFGELTDSAEQRKRFMEALKFRADAGMLSYPVPEEFLSALDGGMPQSSGCAIGFDRLSMIFCNASDIEEVIFEAKRN